MKEEDIINGALIVLDDAKGILFEDKANNIFSCYWYENPDSRSYGVGFVPREDTHGGDSLESIQFLFSVKGWMNESFDIQVEKPLATIDELKFWSMCNPGHEEALRIIYKHLFEGEND